MVFLVKDLLQMRRAERLNEELAGILELITNWTAPCWASSSVFTAHFEAYVFAACKASSISLA
jgi:hypothetical protein